MVHEYKGKCKGHTNSAIATLREDMLYYLVLPPEYTVSVPVHNSSKRN